MSRRPPKRKPKAKHDGCSTLRAMAKARKRKTPCVICDGKPVLTGVYLAPKQGGGVHEVVYNLCADCFAEVENPLSRDAAEAAIEARLDMKTPADQAGAFGTSPGAASAGNKQGEAK